MPYVKPYDLAEVSHVNMLTVESAALVVLAQGGTYERARECAADLPTYERALVLLAVGDAAVVAGNREAASEAYTTSHTLAWMRVADRYRRVEAAGHYGLALMALADRDAWRAAMHLRDAIDAIGEGWWVPRENQAALRELRRLREDVLAGVAMAPDQRRAAAAT